MVKSVRRPDGDASCRFVVKLDKREVVVTVETPDDATRWVVALEKAATAVRFFFEVVTGGGGGGRGGGDVATVDVDGLWIRLPLPCRVPVGAGRIGAVGRAAGELRERAGHLALRQVF